MRPPPPCFLKKQSLPLSERLTWAVMYVNRLLFLILLKALQNQWNCQKFPIPRCVFVRAPLHMRKEEKPTRCHRMLYCTYDTLNMLRPLLYPSSGALDYMCVITAYGVQWLSRVRCRAAGCASRKRDVARRVID